MKTGLHLPRLIQLVILILTVSASGRAAADSVFFFSHLGVQEGLSQVSVLKIYQDVDGFLWFGTRNGLNRYDGYEFTVYRNEVNNQQSLSDNYITDIAEDRNQRLWIATAGGLNCLDSRTGTFIRSYPKELSAGDTNNLVALLAIPQGPLYAFTFAGVFRANPESGKLEEHIVPDTPLTGITTAACAPDGTIWIGTQSDGIRVYTPQWKEIRRYREEVQGNISVLYFDRHDRLWVGTESSGCYRYDSLTDTFTPLNESNSRLGSNYIRALTDYDDALLIGTFAGIYRFDRKTGNVSLIRTDPTGSGTLSHFSVHSLFVDRDRTLWAGTYSAGVNYYNPSYKRVSFIRPADFTGILGMGREDAQGNLWFATEGAGLLRYDPHTGEQTLYPVKLPYKEHFEANILKALLIRGDSILCSTHFGSVYLFSIRSKQYRLLYDFRHNDIYSLYADSRGRLWIPTFSSDSLVCIDRGRPVSEFPADGSMRKFRSVTVINELRPDEFVFGTLNNGLYVYDAAKKTCRTLTASGLGLQPHERLGSVTAIVADRTRGEVYVASTKSGIRRFDRQMNLLKHYQHTDGIADSYISTLVQDAEGTVWAATGNKIYKLNRTTDSFTLFEPGGVPLQEYSLYSGTVAHDGTLYFPGNSGIVTFHPGQLPANRMLPEVYITSLLIDNDPDQPDCSRSSEPLPARSYSVALQPHQTNIVISYTGLSYIHSGQTAYAYKLEGVDADWIPAGARRQAYYSNLPSGRYVFQVKACNSDGVWNPQEAVLYLLVKTPLYRTWFAYLIYIALTAAIIARFVSFRRTRRELENDIRFKQLEKEKIEELHRERIRLFTNFSHELRTPLTLIINPLDDLLQQFSFSEEVKNTLLLIKKNTGRLLLLVNNLMDIQKYEAGKTVLQKSRFDFSAFLGEMYASFESMAGQRNIRFALLSELPPHFYVNYDREEMDKVFFNLLSNAFKFTPAGGSITLIARQAGNEACRQLPGLTREQLDMLAEEQYIYVEVADTGKGIESDRADRIFEPFYRSDEDMHKQIAGTGIGLSLTRSIVWQHNGIIWTQSSPENGTRMMFVLPDTETQPDVNTVTEEPAAGEEPEIAHRVALLMEEAEAYARKVVLIADDNEEVLTYLERQLADDFVIRKAPNGRVALEMIGQSQPDLVISDVMMPEMNGLELCRRIKETSDYRHIPVILLTAKSLVSQIEEGWETGADDYIVKPFHVPLLRARIRNLLAAREKMKEAYGDKLSLKSLGMEPLRPDDRFLHEYMEIVKQNIANPDFDVAVIYRAIGMSRANFYRKVKTVTGLSPIELIKRIRLEAAARLLEETVLNVTEIARQTGFGSGSYFAKNFKAAYGISPTEYQEKHAGKRKSENGTPH